MFKDRLRKLFVEKMTEAIQDASKSFAEELVAELSSTTIEGLFGSTGSTAAAPRSKGSAKGSGRLPRRSAEDLAAAANDVFALLRKAPDGMRSEEIREQLGMEKKELPRVLKEGIESGQIVVLAGQKRSTTYGAKGAKSAKPAKAAKKAKAAAKKPAKAKKAKAAARKPVKAPAKAKKATAKKPETAAKPNGSVEAAASE